MNDADERGSYMVDRSKRDKSWSKIVVVFYIPATASREGIQCFTPSFCLKDRG
jgi:hypothetical protein